MSGAAQEIAADAAVRAGAAGDFVVYVPSRNSAAGANPAALFEDNSDPLAPASGIVLGLLVSGLIWTLFFVWFFQ